MPLSTIENQNISVVDLFCGIGGLTHGLEQSGLNVVTGIDIDEECKFAYEANNRSQFLARDVRELEARELNLLWPTGSIRVLVGCAPCQPFSKYSRGMSKQSAFEPLQKFANLIQETRPEVVSMENVEAAKKSPGFDYFVRNLKESGYFLNFDAISVSNFGIPQSRRRLVLLASQLGPIDLPTRSQDSLPTVRDFIGRFADLGPGEASAQDPLHRTSALSAKNLQRIQHSKPGGSWRDWPLELRSSCHQRASGATYPSVYGRMEWDAPAPTITTQFFGYGNGRFGHPEQDRALSIREGACLQTFPENYQFEGKTKLSFTTLGRQIGNAVPPKLARSIGETIQLHIKGNS